MTGGIAFQLGRAIQAFHFFLDILDQKRDGCERRLGLY